MSLPATPPKESLATVRGGMLAQIRHRRSELPPTARRIAAFIEANAQDIIRMSITDLAELTESSEGSIVALCRRFGASGFAELKILLARDLVEPYRFVPEDISEGDVASRVADEIFGAHAASLEETRRLLSMDSLERAVALIRGAQRIEVYGIGSSAPIAQDLAYRLLQLGLPTHSVVDSHVQAVSAAMIGSRSVVVTVSHSGSTTETVLATRLAKEAGASTIGITRLGKSPLTRYCDVLLHTVASETKYRPEAMSSRVAQLAIIDALVTCCALADAPEAAARLERSARIIAEKRY